MSTHQALKSSAVASLAMLLFLPAVRAGGTDSSRTGPPAQETGMTAVIEEDPVEGPDIVESSFIDTPRGLKKVAGAMLDEIRIQIEEGACGVGKRHKAIDELEEALDELQDAMDFDLWRRQGPFIDPLRLDRCRGKKVFHEECETVEEIFDAIREGKIENEELRATLLEVVDMLVLADHLLAERAIQDAQILHGDPKDIEEALEDFEDGEELVLKAADESCLKRKSYLLCRAIDCKYRHAWDSAIDALDGRF